MTLVSGIFVFAGKPRFRSLPKARPSYSLGTWSGGKCFESKRCPTCPRWASDSEPSSGLSSRVYTLRHPGTTYDCFWWYAGPESPQSKFPAKHRATVVGEDRQTTFHTSDRLAARWWSIDDLLMIYWWYIDGLLMVYWWCMPSRADRSHIYVICMSQMMFVGAVQSAWSSYFRGYICAAQILPTISWQMLQRT